jgi:hypothetical protein
VATGPAANVACVGAVSAGIAKANTLMSRTDILQTSCVSSTPTSGFAALNVICIQAVSGELPSGLPAEVREAIFST